MYAPKRLTAKSLRMGEKDEMTALGERIAAGAGRRRTPLVDGCSKLRRLSDHEGFCQMKTTHRPALTVLPSGKEVSTILNRIPSVATHSVGLHPIVLEPLLVYAVCV